MDYTSLDFGNARSLAFMGRFFGGKIQYMGLKGRFISWSVGIARQGKDEDGRILGGDFAMNMMEEGRQEKIKRW